MKYELPRALTERLDIRMLGGGDYEAFVRGYNACIKSQNRFDEGRMDTEFMTREWFDALIARRRSEADADVSYMLNIFLRSTGESIGYCDITPHQREEFQYGRIGCTLHNPYWGKGYGTECIRALVKLAFSTLGLHRLEAHIDGDNTASKNAVTKAGLKFECVRRGFILENGAWTDKQIYFINAPHWGGPAPGGENNTTEE